MKSFCITAISFLFLSAGILQAQIVNPKDVIRNKGEQRTNSGVDRGVDKGLDKLEEGIGNIFKKKDKKQPEQPEETNTSTSEVSTSEVNHVKESVTPVSSQMDYKVYSKFDFVPGEKVLYFDNFERVETGDFPADWNTNAAGEVVNINNKEGKWLMLSQNGVFIPENIKALDDNFTMEFDLGVDSDVSNNLSGFTIIFKNTNKAGELFDGFSMNQHAAYVTAHPADGSSHVTVHDANSEVAISNSQATNQFSGLEKPFVKVSIWRQKGRLRIYFNEQKVWDIPRFFTGTEPFYIAFEKSIFGEGNVLLSNVKYAIGAPDTRNKLITEGKFVTTGILFDSNSDRIKAESHGTLKEISKVLSENPSINVKIIGHTDSDGTDEANLTLSKKRAESVKNALVSEFGISASRLTTDGKGESEPAGSNATPEGKANNRRVEFVKQ